MIINNTYGFIFIHIPKTAGTSVTSFLSKLTSYADQEIGGTKFGEDVQQAYKNRFGMRKHSTAVEVRNIVGQPTWNRYFSFSFVRNPFARCLSTYHFLREWNGFEPERQVRMNSFTSFEEFVLSDLWSETAGPDGIFSPQVSWLQSRGMKDQVIVDFVGRLENLRHDLRHCLTVIGNQKLLLDFGNVPNLNKSGRARDKPIFSRAVIDKIIEKYHVDFVAFDYSTDIEDM